MPLQNEEANMRTSSQNKFYLLGLDAHNDPNLSGNRKKQKN